MEDLLVWAYRAEMVHQALPEWMIPEAVIRDFAPKPDWQTDRVTAGDNVGFKASDDAYRVHEAVLALGRAPLTVPAWEPPASEPFRAVDDQTYLPRRDAMATSSWSDLMIVSALRGAPEWCDAPEVTMRRRGVVHEKLRNGEPRRDRNGRFVERLCLVDFTGDLPWIVDHCRFLYGRWALGLARLRESLAGGMLTAHVLTNELPSLSPWE